MLSVIRRYGECVLRVFFAMLSVVALFYCYDECRYAEYLIFLNCYIENRYAEYRYAEYLIILNCHTECRYTEYHYAECQYGEYCCSSLFWNY